MNKKIIYSGFDTERHLIVDNLKNNYGWEPVFLHLDKSSRQWAEECYPEAVFRDGMELRQAYFDYSKIGAPVPIDAKIIAALSKYELSCLNILEDTTGWNFSFTERRQYYYDILKYWNTVIHHLKPDIYVDGSRPHMIADYTLYLLCKHYYSIPTVFIEAAPHFNAYYNTVSTSLEDFSKPFNKYYTSKEHLELHPDVSKYLNDLRDEKGRQPDHILRKYAKSEKLEDFQFKQFIRLVIVTLLCGTGFRKIPIAYKKNQKSFDSSDSRMSWFEYFWFRDRLRRKNKRLRKIYARLCFKPDLNVEYVYFAAPYQPEATTCPNAGVYEDLFLVLDMLSANIPKNWIIYYKENPATFFGGGKGSLRRDRNFYKKIAAYYNVKMVSVDTDPYAMIDRAKMVVSVAGTTSWEAVVRGKPAMFFGNIWYQGCKSLFKINTCQDCIDAVEKVRNGYVPDQKDVERYASAMQKASVKGMIHRDFSERIKECPDPKHEMERIAKALHEAYERHYGEYDIGIARVDDLLRKDMHNEMVRKE